MSILVAYASKQGATQEIAERIGEKLRAAGQLVEVWPVDAISNLERYDAFVIGSAVYYFHWQKKAIEFIRRNRTILVSRPVWLFSSGPLGTQETDAQGRDVRATSGPQEMAEFLSAIRPRDHHVFFGAINRRRLQFPDRIITILLAGRTLIPDGDFRDWTEIESWADSIAHELKPVSV